jgi:hypothetical protein
MLFEGGLRGLMRRGRRLMKNGRKLMRDGRRLMGGRCGLMTGWFGLTRGQGGLMRWVRLLQAGMIMAKEIKRIPVRDQEQAATIINQLCQQFEMRSDTMRHQLHVSNGKYAAFYDAEEGMVKMEAIHPGVTEEEIKEFLMEFPPFF